MKRITCTDTKDGNPFYINRTEKSIKFYDYDTHRVYVRKLWVDCVEQPHVWLNGEFRSLSYLTFTDDGLPFTIGNYEVC